MVDGGPKKTNALESLADFKIEYPTLQSQKRWAEARKIAAALMYRATWLDQNAFGSGREFEFELRLIRFAERKKIDLSKDDWRNRAMIRAAEEHPQLQPNYRQRGRPKKITNALAEYDGFGGGAEEQKELIKSVEEISKLFSQFEKRTPMSDARAAYWLVIFEYLKGFEDKAIPIPEWGSAELEEFIGSADFIDRHNAMKMRVSRARQAVTRKST